MPISFICSNYDFSGTELDGKTEKFIIKEMDGIKIGIFGLELAGWIFQIVQRNRLLRSYLTSKHAVINLMNISDLVICLSHLGHDYNTSKISDVKLAKISKNIDVIGGLPHILRRS